MNGSLLYSILKVYRNVDQYAKSIESSESEPFNKNRIFCQSSSDGILFVEFNSFHRCRSTSSCLLTPVRENRVASKQRGCCAEAASAAAAAALRSMPSGTRSYVVTYSQLPHVPTHTHTHSKPIAGGSTDERRRSYG